jgi:hypothetical protein
MFNSSIMKISVPAFSLTPKSDDSSAPPLVHGTLSFSAASARNLKMMATPVEGAPAAQEQNTYFLLKLGDWEAKSSFKENAPSNAVWNDLELKCAIDDILLRTEELLVEFWAQVCADIAPAEISFLSNTLNHNSLLLCLYRSLRRARR